jgi:hypothetical protein
MNAQVPPLEMALTRAGIACVRGQRFFERPGCAGRPTRRLPSACGLAAVETLEARA